MSFIIQTTLELGVMYALVSMALYMSFRVLDIADLTTDGAFVLGMAVSVTAAAAGHPVWGLFAAMLCGAAAGFVTALLQTRLGVPSILAGIVTNTGLYTVNLMAMGWTSNANILKHETIFSLFRSALGGSRWSTLLLASLITLLAGVFLIWFLGTRVGLSLRATGDNRDMVRASSINPAHTVTIGLCFANALTALSGAVVGQAQRSADINAGTGIVVVGLACLIIGETVCRRGSVRRGVIATVVGSVLYRFIYAVVLRTKIVPIECLKLVTALIVGLAIAMPSIRSWLGFERRKLRASGRKEG